MARGSSAVAISAIGWDERSRLITRTQLAIPRSSVIDRLTVLEVDGFTVPAVIAVQRCAHARPSVAGPRPELKMALRSQSCTPAAIRVVESGHRWLIRSCR